MTDLAQEKATGSLTTPPWPSPSPSPRTSRLSTTRHRSRDRRASKQQLGSPPHRGHSSSPPHVGPALVTFYAGCSRRVLDASTPDTPRIRSTPVDPCSATVDVDNTITINAHSKLRDRWSRTSEDPRSPMTSPGEMRAVAHRRRSASSHSHSPGPILKSEERRQDKGPDTPSAYLGTAKRKMSLPLGARGYHHARNSALHFPFSRSSRPSE